MRFNIEAKGHRGSGRSGSAAVRLPTQFLDLACYVKSMSVDETDLGGRSADRIVGTLDTQALVSDSGDVHAAGHTAHMHMSIAVNGINKPVPIPYL